MNTETKIVWTRVDGKRPKREAVLVGRQISPDWLSSKVNLTQVRLTGGMKQAFGDFITAAKNAKLNLPVVSLRTALICRMDNVVTLNKDLGLVARKNGGSPCAVEFYTPADEDLPVAHETLSQTIKDWVINDVEAWAKRNGMAHLVSRLREAISPADIELTPIQEPYIGDNGLPNYPLIARSVGERLIGEELFEGLGNCELVASPEYRSNSVELMTLPRRGAIRDEIYSMVARLTIVSVPYSKGVYLKVSAVKRVWAKKPPTMSSTTAFRVTAYVMAVGRPVTKVGVVETENGWEFGEEYISLFRESNKRLPSSLSEAIAQREFNSETGWWSGLPELPPLFRSVSPHNVFESDEISLLQTISNILDPIVSNKAIPYREVKLPQFQTKPRQEILKLSDFGVAGSVFNTDEDRDNDEEDFDQDAGSREDRLKLYSKQNMETLKRVHMDTMPVVWMFGGSPAEQELTCKAIGILFGNTVTIYTKPLPEGTHGLRADLDLPEGTARQRFDTRVKCWQKHTKKIKEVSDNRHIIALICASNRVGKKQEDSVNYYAGIHAMSSIGANVHHVLPIEEPDDPKSKQAFLHRVQSALLDVMLAHTGAVFGVKEFVERLLPEEQIPQAIYGVQAVQSHAQSHRGQIGGNFILYSRLVVEDGKTEVRIGYLDGTKSQLTDWMPLIAGLSWIGSQHRLRDGDANWLKAAFSVLTRQALVDITENDPKAIVLIEWDSVRSLWKGISDVDLGVGNSPRLDTDNLAQLKNMTLIRLRRGHDTLPLRTLVKTTFKGWKESDGVRSDTGEIKPDAYVTTDIRLIEIADESLPNERHSRHYIASMGYAKTVQVKQGFSCYRTMPRMSRVGKGLTEFEQKILDVASKDASSPAPMEVTVMLSPEGVEPNLYAILSMGLRLGYAHYNDWTTLPIPLFFRRKIEDYVIRYPEQTDDSGTEDTAAGDIPEQIINPTRYSELVAQEAEGVLEEALMPDEITPDIFGIYRQNNDADLLSRVKHTTMPVIMAYGDYQSRQLYQSMINGDAEVRVELPYWVRTRGIFAITGAVTKRRVQRSWNRMRDFGYVKSGISMPRVDCYMDWLAEKLRIPQVCTTIILATREIGQISFAPMVDLIEQDFNASHPQEEQVNPYSISDDMLVRMAKWADSHQHDELMSWLVFMESQLPNPKRPQLVIKNIHTIPGPRTEHALEYYLATASAINRVLDQKHNRGHIKVHLELPKMTTEQTLITESEVLEASHSEAPTIAESVASLALYKITSERAQESDPIMTTKKSLIQLIEEIEPGSNNFDAILLQIQAQVGTLLDIHTERKMLHAAAAAMTEKMDRFIEHQKAMAEQINAMQEMLEINRVGSRKVQQEDLEAATDELSKVDEAITNLSTLLKQLDELERSPAPSSLQERKKQKDIEQQIAENAFSRAEEVRSLLQNGLCFDIEVPDTPPSKEDVTYNTLVESIAKSTTQEIPDTPPAMTEADSASIEQSGPGLIPAIKLEVRALPEPEAASCMATETEKVDSPLLCPEVKAAELAPMGTLNLTELEKTIPPAPNFMDLEQAAAKGNYEAYSEEAEFSAGNADLESKIGTLRTLVQRRLYGLADVHVTAIGSMIDGSVNPESQVHHSILSAMVRALSAMDCQFSFDIKLNSKLNEFLTSEKLPSGDVSDPAHMALGILAAGLGNMLFDDSDVQWRIGNAVSTRLAGHTALSNLVEHLDLIRQRGFVLTRDLFVRSRIGAKNALDLELVRFQKRAESWKQAPEIHSTFNHRGFIALHEEMFSLNNPIGRCLGFISKGDTTKVAAAYEEAKRKFEKPAQTVDELYKKNGEKSKPDGLFRVRAIENIETTEKFVESYLDHAKRRNSQNAELTRDVQSFLDELNRKLTEAIKEVRLIETHTELEALYRDAVIKAFECTIRLFDTQEPAAYIPDDKQKLLIQWPLGKDLMPTMNKLDNLTPPLCTPDDVFDQTRRLAKENLILGDPSSEDDIDKALADAYQGHLAANRFLPAFLIEAMLPKPMLPKGQTLLMQYKKERDTQFLPELQDARQKVAHAMTLSAITQEETNRMQRLIEELLMLCRSERSIGMPDVESVTYPDFPQARAALRCNVLQPLEARLSEAKARLETELEEEEIKGVVPIADIVRIKNMLESRNAATLRTAYDALAMLRQSGKLPARMLGSGNLADEYDAFMESLRKSTGSTKHLLDEMKKRLSADMPSENEPEWLADLDPDQRGEAVELIDAWLEFFSTRTSTNFKIAERLFRAMGIPIPPSPYPEHARGSRARFIVDDKTFLFPTTADDPMFIPPALGSWATHIQCYALFGATQENEIRQLMQEIGSSPTLVLARTHFNMQKRAKVSGNSPVILIDDDLLAYAALHPSERLQTLIKVGMLTFSTNPYDDYNTKPVPTEMFFGRQEELARLRGVKGLAVLFGGRRLGKSSLLSQIEQESRNFPGQEAVYVSMDTVNTVGEYVLSAWEFIYRALLNRKIIQPISGAMPTQWKLILQHIEKGLIESSQLKSLFLLIDEADNLMGCELRRKHNDDSFVRSLTQLADNVAHACHVRMVIAGLHNMTRMANDENSVFGKAEPIPLKPFSSADDVQRGIRLITKPLAAMGYVFGQGAEDLPLRILSVCNFYPAFIQLYCKRLVERLQNNRQDKRPPIEISVEDLNAVEKDSNLLSELREKFKLNLNLDKRYKAIALILADVYYTEIEDGQYSGLTTTEIREHCEAYCGGHFENTGPGVYEALLDEMIKLNVLEKVGTRYVLRNPNIAMMVGDRDRVTTLINELANEPPETSRNQGERRIRMTRNNDHMVFPMPMSWIRNHMDASDGELLILTGNALSGIMELTRVERDEWHLQDGGFVSVPGNSPQNLADLLAKNRRLSQDARIPKFMSVRNSAWRVDQIPEYAVIANKASKSGIRIILLAHPERALEITTALESGKLKPSSDNQRAWRVVPIPPWTDDAIYYWMHENIQVAESREAISAIRAATCGFGKEVDELCKNLTLERALAAPEARRKVLALNLDLFYQRIGMPPALIEERGDSIKDFLDLMNGVDRSNFAEFEENMQEFRITKDMFQFLYWMGLIQEGPEHTWTVPPLYAELIT